MDLARTDSFVALRSDSTAERNAAWRALYRDSFDRIYRLVCRYGIPPADVEDVVQQTFAIAHRRLADDEAIENVRGWLCGIAVKVCSDHHRWRRVRRLKRTLVESTFRSAASSPPTPEGSAEALEIQQLVGAVLARMSPKLRDVLVLADIEELSIGEVSDILDVPPNTVRSRRARAREQFARLWERTGGRR